MQNLMNDLTQLFQKDERIFADGKLLKNKLTELALKLDEPLIELLLSDEKAREHFFIEKVAGKDKVLVFDKDKFIAFVNNKEFLPDSFTSFENKIGLMANGDYLKEKGEVVLAWAYKDCVLEGGMEHEYEKRNEVFYSEILAPDEIDRLREPKVLTNFKRFDKTGGHKVTEIIDKDNMIIKGNNLLALHSIKKKYLGKIKLIYLDPPYNKKGDSFYNDSFKHSSWLTFMKNRLDVAKDLLTPDGLLFVQIDSNEVAYLHVLLDAIFDNMKQCIVTIKVKSPSGDSSKTEKLLEDVSEYLLIYSKAERIKNKNPLVIKEIVDENSKTASQYHSLLINKGKTGKKAFEFHIGSQGNRTLIEVFSLAGLKIQSVPRKELSRDFYVNNYERICRTAKFSGEFLEQFRGKTGCYFFKYTPSRGRNAGKEIDTYVVNGEGLIYLKDYSGIIELSDGTKAVAKLEVVSNMIDDIPWQGIANEGGVTLVKGKKPEELIRRVLEWTTEPGDIVLDYFLGSGTTAAVAHKMGRQYVGIEQLDYGENDSVVRLKKVINRDPTGISKDVGWKGGGSFVYVELMEWNETYITEIQKADTTPKLLNIYEKMKKEAFFRYDIDLSEFDEKEFGKLSLKEQKQVLIECLDKNHLYVNLSEIDDTTYKVSEEDKRLNKEFYKVVV